MKICIVSEYYYPVLGGITEHVYNYVTQCLLRGHEVTLLTSEAGKIPEHLVPKGLKIHKIGRSYPVMSNESFARVTLSPWLGKKVREFFQKNQFDVIHTHALMAPMLPILSFYYKTAPIVGTLHTYFDRSSLYELFQPLLQKAISLHDGIIAVSPSCIEAMERYFQLNASVIPNGVNVDYFASGVPMLKYKDGVFTILFLGRLDPRNGLDTLIDAYHLLREKGHKVRLVVAGDSPLRSLYVKKVKTEWKDGVEFLGAVNKERPDLFASVDVFCYPATKASFGITLLEAMSAGLPVVASKIRGFREIVTDGQDGFLVPETHPVALAEAFEKLISDRNLKLRMGEKGRATAQKYAWTHVADQILDFYKTLGNKKPEHSAVSAHASLK